LSTLRSIDRLTAMIRYFLKRLAGAIPTLLIIVTLTFFLVRVAPGGPFDQEQTLPPEIIANLQSAYGLDQPMWVQYGRYLRALAHGDLAPRSSTRTLRSPNSLAKAFRLRSNSEQSRSASP